MKTNGKGSQMSPLTPREKVVLEQITKAMTNKEIATALRVSPSTVKRHLENILRKLCLKNRTEAAIHAMGARFHRHKRTLRKTRMGRSANRHDRAFRGT